MHRELIQETLKETIKENLDETGWVNLVHLGPELVKNGLDYKNLGYPKLVYLIKSNTDVIEWRKDTSNKTPDYYVKVREEPQRRSKQQRHSSPKSALFDWAYLGNYESTIRRLKDLSLKERWYYKEQDPNYPYPILVNYLHYTFYRLTKEKDKILETTTHATFNTGLVDHRYEPIYALFGRNDRDMQKWRLLDFCIPGEGRAGKDFVRNFKDKPGRAHYFDNVTDLLYDTKASSPELDLNHIIIDNVNRLPLGFILENAPSSISVRNPSILSVEERKTYFQALKEAISRDSKAYRSMTNRFKDALDLSLKRIEWNFKTAIPQYFPTLNAMSLLLPLSLVDDEAVDVALVVERTKSGNYLGHTILPLKWAYSNARLVARPDSDWLVAEKISTGVSDDDDESEDE